jgi:hypothetical protein
MWFGNPRWMPRQQCALSIGLYGKIYFLEATNMIAPKLYELSLTKFFLCRSENTRCLSLLDIVTLLETKYLKLNHLKANLAGIVQMLRGGVDLKS